MATFIMFMIEVGMLKDRESRLYVGRYCILSITPGVLNLLPSYQVDINISGKL